jgi:hypothetical protein
MGSGNDGNAKLMEDGMEEAEFEIYDGDELYARCSGPYDRAFREALNYASQCDEPMIERIRREKVELPWS